MQAHASKPSSEPGLTATEAPTASVPAQDMTNSSEPEKGATSAPSTSTSSPPTTTTTTTDVASTEPQDSPVKKPLSKKKPGNKSKKLVSRNASRRTRGEEAIELAVSSSDDDSNSDSDQADNHHRSRRARRGARGDQSESGSGTDDPDTEEEADLQIKRQVLEKLSLERKEESSPAPKTPPRSGKRHQQGHIASPESRTRSGHGRDSAPASPTPTSTAASPSSTPAPGSTPGKKARRPRNKREKNEAKLNSPASTPTKGENDGVAANDKKPASTSSSDPTNASEADREQQQPATDSKPQSTKSKRYSKQGVASAKPSEASPSPMEEPEAESNGTDNWGDSPLPPQENKETTNEDQPSKPPSSHSSRPAPRGRGGRSVAMEARSEYRKKLAEDPRFVPHLGEFWGHDDRYRGAGLKNFGERGNFRGRFMGRGGFGRGGMQHGSGRGDFRNGQPLNDQPQVNEDRVEETKPKSDRWSHDGYDQLMKVQEKSYRPHRNDSRPRSMNNKHPSRAQTSSSNQSTQVQEDSTPQTGTTTAPPPKQERPRSSAQFGEKDVKRASRLLHSALPKPTQKPPASTEPVVNAANTIPAASAASNSTPSKEAAESEDGVKQEAGKDQGSSMIQEISTPGIATENASSPTGPGAPKQRQQMPHNQPPIQHGGFRPQFIPGNFASRGRGRGGFHHGHGHHFGGRGGHHYGPHHQHHHHHHHPRPSGQAHATTTPAHATESTNATVKAEQGGAGKTDVENPAGTHEVSGSKRYLGSRQEDANKERTKAMAADAEDLGAKETTEADFSRAKDMTPPTSSKSLKTAINAAPFKPSSPFIPPQQVVTNFNAEEEYYGEDYGAEGFYYGQQQQPMPVQPMYYYYYPSVGAGAPSAAPGSMPMGVPMPMPAPMPMGVPVPGQPFMPGPPMYYDGSVPVPAPGSSAPPTSGSSAAPVVPGAPGPAGMGGEMMMMVMAPEDYNNYYYYQPTVFYPPPPPNAAGAAGSVTAPMHPPTQHPESRPHPAHGRPSTVPVAIPLPGPAATQARS
ncbi:hypothetical protein BGW38_002557 [Lunasporangiospora selenospora]|uniref:Btz domain-containing protein n=1 Tax=Lunasporangiospora selenospora TaxID=979761 RepID=A0A9P6FT31_9FUNG|nr:hypothetical protein BGW38_002557 [Lunasporangiospora selenospora]